MRVYNYYCMYIKHGQIITFDKVIMSRTDGRIILMKDNKHEMDADYEPA